jgi:hypothetical protein
MLLSLRLLALVLYKCCSLCGTSVGAFEKEKADAETDQE